MEKYLDKTVHKLLSAIFSSGDVRHYQYNE